jgi:hypothetical protein
MQNPGGDMRFCQTSYPIRIAVLKSNAPNALSTDMPTISKELELLKEGKPTDGNSNI